MITRIENVYKATPKPVKRKIQQPERKPLLQQTTTIDIRA